MSDWWTNWGSTSSGAQQAAASDFLATGNVGTPIGGTRCRGSAECASGYACSGGRCVPINGSKPNSDGTLSGCGGEAGGPCDSLTGTNVGVTNGSGTVYGDVVITQGGVSTGYQWEPVYAADGCTIAGCKLGPCGSEGGGDCPGNRYCRYDQNGNVSCGCGDPPSGACTVFCDSYFASFGAGAAGCEGKTCDECAGCDGNYFSSTYNTCVPSSGSTPCQCEPEKIPECTRCNEDGTTVPDEENCGECYTTSLDCGCGLEIEKTCCYTLEELKNGLDGFSRCRDEIGVRCAEECKKKPFQDPCFGTCVSQDPITGDGPCPTSISITVDEGQLPIVRDCIETPNGFEALWDLCDIDIEDVPPECLSCDCNCHNDCPNCELCNAQGKCEPDPACDTPRGLIRLWIKQLGADVLSGLCGEGGSEIFTCKTDRALTQDLTTDGEIVTVGDMSSKVALSRRYSTSCCPFVAGGIGSYFRQEYISNPTVTFRNYVGNTEGVVETFDGTILKTSEVDQCTIDLTGFRYTKSATVVYQVTVDNQVVYDLGYVPTCDNYLR